MAPRRYCWQNMAEGRSNLREFLKTIGYVLVLWSTLAVAIGFVISLIVADVQRSGGCAAMIAGSIAGIEEFAEDVKEELQNKRE